MSWHAVSVGDGSVERRVSREAPKGGLWRCYVAGPMEPAAEMVIEMIGGFTDSGAHAADLLEQVQREGTFRDQRYKPDWLQKRISELRAS